MGEVQGPAGKPTAVQVRLRDLGRAAANDGRNVRTIFGRRAPELHARPGEIYRSGEKRFTRPGIAKDLVLGHARDDGLEAGREADRLAGTGAGEDTGHHWEGGYDMWVGY